MGLTPGITVISSPGAIRRVVMPRVGLTWGRQAGGDARGEPHPGLHLGPSVYVGVLGHDTYVHIVEPYRPKLSSLRASLV